MEKSRFLTVLVLALILEVNAYVLKKDKYVLKSSLSAHDKSKRSYSKRPGKTTSMSSCDRIRGVPYELRAELTSESIPGPNKGLSQFYQKYTEAYGLPILGSNNVKDEALQRTCYTIRFLFADRPDVRQAYYSNRGRFALMSVNEQTTDIPEHAWMDSYWNQRARGLGATPHAPVCTGGEENALCWRDKDRYPKEDILLHEFSHGLKILGVNYVLPNFEQRLKQLYDNCQANGKWAKTYAMTNPDEYWAEAVQSYFNVNNYADPADGIHGPIDTNDKLKTYDPQMYALISEIFCCKNTYLKRCTDGNRRQNELNQDLKTNCCGTKTTEQSCTDDNIQCVQWAIAGECQRNPKYMLDNCKFSCNNCDGVTQVTTILPTLISTTPGSGTECVDKNMFCANWAAQGECTKNLNWMPFNCRRSCGLCGTENGTTVPCIDTNVSCAYWASIGECTKNPDWMPSNCRRSCKTC